MPNINISSMKKRLSICIPVYNCGEFLPQALDSILPQRENLLEVIVFDGGSTDNTQELMEGYLKSWPHLRYERAAERGGIDLDMSRAIDFASGEYCWLFSGDDVMRPGAINAIFEWLELSFDVYICRHTICDKSLNILNEHPVLTQNIELTVDLSLVADRAKWFQSAATTEAFFSFMSGLIVRTEKWKSIHLPPLFIGSCWGHVARLFELSQNGLKVGYIPKVLLDQRGENDSFSDKGIVNRYRIGIEEYGRISEYYFGKDSLEAFHIRRVLRNELSLRVFLRAKNLTWRFPEREDRKVLDHIVKYVYQDSSFKCYINKAIYLLFAPPLFDLIQPLYKRLKKIVNAIR